MTTQLRLELFGGVNLTLDNQPLKRPLSRKARALLCYLAVTRQPHSRTALAGLLWPDVPEVNARANLRKELTHLRRTLRSFVQANREEIAFSLDANSWSDVDEFKRLIARQTDVNQLSRAVALFRGDFLADFYVLDAPTFDSWVLVERAHLRDEALQALHQLIAQFSRDGEIDAAINCSKRLLLLEPWREEAQRQLMELYAHSGQRGAALAQYEICRRVLADELDVEPGPETTELYERIRAGNVEREQQKPERNAGPLQPAIDPPSFLHSDLAELDSVTPFVARERELKALDARLDDASSGTGGIFFVVGEAGSGKSSLIREFSQRAQNRQKELIVVAGNCNAYAGIGDPYLPWREIVAMLTGDIETRWSAGVITRDHALRLWHLVPDVVQILVDTSPDLVETLVTGKSLINRFATHGSAISLLQERLHDLVLHKTEVTASHGPDQGRLFEQVTSFLTELSTRRPLLIILDDLHWADLSTISLLFHLGRSLGVGAPESRVLILGTYRPENLSSELYSGGSDRHPLDDLVSELQSRYGAISIDLSLIEEEEARQFVDSLLDAEPNRLDHDFRNTLFQHTEGHALFTVELLREMQERGDLLRDEGKRWIVGPTLDWRTLPAQVEGVIGKRMGQLDRVLRQILNVASIEGEEFTVEVVAQVTGLDQRQIVRLLSGELDRKHHLVSARGTRRLGSQRISSYRFRHNLFQHYLYRQLDGIERVAYHEDVGRALESLYADQSSEISAQLAWQYQRAEMSEKAVEHLLQAGRNAVRLSAYEEAISHLTRALSLLESLPDGEARARQELSLQLNLGVSLQTTQGWPADKVGEAYHRARELCEQLNDREKHFRVLWGLQHFHIVRGELKIARELGVRHLELAQKFDDPAQLVAGHFMQAGPLTSMGEFVSANEHWTQSIAHYDPEQHHELANQLGSDPGVFCRAWAAHALWSLGYPDQALRMGQEALKLARKLSHPFSLVVALDYLAMLHQFRREARDARLRADEAIDICTEQGFAYYLAWAQIIRGWSVVEEGDSRAGVVQIERGLFDLLATGARLREPYYLCLFAEATARAEDIERGLSILRDAQKAMERNGEHWREAEISRLRGEILQMQASVTDECEAAFHEAIEVARQQQAMSLELRARVSLSKYWSSNGKTADALTMLTDAIAWFEEGFETPDLQEATALLEKWQ